MTTGTDLAAARRPWAVLPIYLSILALSILYQTGVASAISLTDASSGGFARVWRWLLTAGAIAATLGVLAGPRRVLTARIVECLGAGVLAIEEVIYAGAVIAHRGHAMPWATILFVAGLTGACALRTVLALWERGRLLQAFAVLEAARREVAS